MPNAAEPKRGWAELLVSLSRRTALFSAGAARYPLSGARRSGDPALAARVRALLAPDIEVQPDHV